jgi:hypothetical protein
MARARNLELLMALIGIIVIMFAVQGKTDYFNYCTIDSVYVILKICIVHCVLASDCDFFPEPSVVVEARKTVSAERVYCLNTPNVKSF